MEEVFRRLLQNLNETPDLPEDIAEDVREARASEIAEVRGAYEGALSLMESYTSLQQDAEALRTENTELNTKYASLKSIYEARFMPPPAYMELAREEPAFINPLEVRKV